MTKKYPQKCSYFVYLSVLVIDLVCKIKKNITHKYFWENPSTK